jgi:DNA-binding SARP family transcriptional activator
LAPVAVVEAGAGYGKSTLAVETGRGLGVAFVLVPLESRDADPGMFVIRLERALRRAGMSDLAASVAEAASCADDAVDALIDALAAREDPVILALDDAHFLGGPSARLATRLMRSIGAPHRLWILARRLPAELDDARLTSDALTMGTADLAFTTAEAAALCATVLGDESPAASLMTTAGGWPAALVMGALASSKGHAEADRLRGDAGRTIADLVRRALVRLDEPDREAIVAVARLPLLSPDVADAATGRTGLLDRAAAAGLPLVRGAAGWWEFPGPVADHFATLGRPNATVALRAAPLFVTTGEPGAAIDTLIAAGEDGEAARLLAGLPAAALERLDDLEVQAAVASLSPESVRSAPAVLVHLARTCENRSLNERRTAALDLADEIAAATGDEVLGREVAVERARDLVRHGNVQEAEAAAREVMAATGPSEITTRARAAIVLGTALVRHGVRTADAEPVLEEAHRLSLAVGRREWAVHAWMLLAMGVYMVLGRNADAVKRVEEAVALLPARSGQRALALTMQAELLNESGRYDEARAVLSESRRLAVDLRLPRAHAYAAWEAARTASQTGDAEAVLSLVRETEQHRGAWYDMETGAIFLADAADMLSRVNSPEAATYLARAVDRRDDSPFAVLLAEGIIAARSGDPEAAERLLVEASAHERCTPRDDWRITLMRAYAASRRGSPQAVDLAARAMQEAADLGNADLPLIRERAVAESLLPLLRDGAGAAIVEPANLPARVGALGGFRVLRGSAELTLPTRHPELLVKLLVAIGGRAHAEVVIEALWPEVEPASGRKRLRNTLFRLRGAAGDLVVRDGDAISLAPDVEIDALGFDREARIALAEPDRDHRAALAMAAAARYAGDLLPDDPYEEWAAGPREKLRGRYLSLLDLLIADAEARGDVDEAIRLLERAGDADPLDDERPTRAARLLLSQGRRAAAEAAAARAEAILAELGLPATTELVAMRGHLAT